MSKKTKTAEELLKLKPGGVLVAMHRVSPRERGMLKPPSRIEADEEAQVWGTVVAVGPSIKTDYGAEIDSPAKRGDVVAVGRYSGTKMQIPVIGEVRFVLFGEILLTAEVGSLIADKLESEQEKIREEIRELNKPGSPILTTPRLVDADGGAI